MKRTGKQAANDLDSRARSYRLHAQVGYRLRVANQIGVELFAGLVGTLGGASPITTAQFAALSMLWERSELAQTELSRLTSMDMPTLNGVLKRLVARRLVKVTIAEKDKRFRGISLTKEGRSLTRSLRAQAHLVTQGVLSPLTKEERKLLLGLLQKLIESHRVTNGPQAQAKPKPRPAIRQGTARVPVHSPTISVD